MTPLPADRATNLAIWAVIWSALLAWQAIAAGKGLPTIATVVRILRSWWVTRWLLLFGWGWLGWHLFVRTTY